MDKPTTKPRGGMTPRDKEFLSAIEKMAADIIAERKAGLELENAKLRAALQPFAEIWEKWLVERERPDSPFTNINAFAVSKLSGADVNVWREALCAFNNEDAPPTYWHPSNNVEGGSDETDT